MLKTIKELRDFKLHIDSRNLVIARIQDLHKRNFDYNIYLPSKGKNLQRDLVWNLQQKRELIYSLILDRPIPPISIMIVRDYTNESSEDIIQVIDGKQRLHTFKEFYNNEFDIELEGSFYYFKDLPEEYKITISFFPVTSQRILEEYNSPIADEDKIKWFKLLNFAGTPQDLDHLKDLEGTL